MWEVLAGAQARPSRCSGYSLYSEPHFPKPEVREEDGEPGTFCNYRLWMLAVIVQKKRPVCFQKTQRSRKLWPPPPQLFLEIPEHR